MNVVVDQTGRMHLPDKLRIDLGVESGGELVLEERAGEWVLRRASSDEGLAWEGDVLVHKGKMTRNTSIGELLEEDREARLDRLSDGFTQ